MAFHIPKDPFLTDALGAAKFARESLKRARKKKLDLDAAIYWGARQACHLAQKSLAWNNPAAHPND